MANEVNIKVKADADGLSGEIKRAVDLASASPFNIKIAASVTGTQEAMAKAITEAKVEAARAGIEMRVSAKLDEKSKAGIGTALKDMFSGVQGVGTGASAGVIAAFTSPVGLSVAIPIIGGLVSSIAALGGVLPVAAAGLGLLGTAGVTLKLGMTGVTEAITAYATAQDAANGKTAQLAAQQLSTSNSIISADLAVKNSRQSLADAYRNSANTIISAQEAVGNAQQAQVTQAQSASNAIDTALDSQASAYRQLQNAEDAESRAQQGVIDAKEAASRSLEDSTNKVVDSEHAHEQAIINLNNAQTALLKPQSSTGPPPNIMQLSLAVRDAQQRVIETQQAWDRAGQDATKASTLGVDGSKQVIGAQDTLRAAINSVASAQQAIGTANENLARTYIANDVAKGNADQRLGDANRALQQAQIAGDEQIQRAKEAVNAALRAQQQTLAAAAASAESAAGSLAAYNAALAELAPNAQDAVRATTGLYETWKSLKLAVQDRLFAGVGDDIRSIGTTVLPVVQAGLVRMAGALNEVVRAFAAWLTSKDAVRDMGTIFDNVASAVQNLAPAIRPMMQIITDLITVASSFLPGMSKGFADSAQGAADFIRNARDSGQLKVWMQSGIDAITELWHIVRDVVLIFADLSAGPTNHGLLTLIQDLIGGIRWFFDNIPHATLLIEGFIGAWALWKVVSGVSAVIAVIKEWTVVQWLLNVAMDANPIGLVVLAVAALAAGAYLIYRNWGGVTDFFAGLWKGITSWFKWGVNEAIFLINGLIHGINNLAGAWNWIPGVPKVPAIPDIPHWLATGGIGSGLTVIGEHGPELVNLPAGSQVSSAANTQTQLAGMGGGPQTIILKVDASGTTPFEAAMGEFMRNYVRVVGGGNVQRAFS